jgi:N-acetylglutamate synthase-like GNAT family acetyltransferase
MILKCEQSDTKEVCDIINDAAVAYKTIIPADSWKEPYMSEEELENQIDEGVQFWCWKEHAEMMGVMGIQYKEDVTLIRHAYVRSVYRNKGIGSKLLAHLNSIATTPILIGTWAAATWAIDFYLKHGYHLLSKTETETLLRKYWSIPDRQIETSVVLASKEWKNQN